MSNTAQTILSEAILSILWSTESIQETTINVLSCYSTHVSAVCIEFWNVVLSGLWQRGSTNKLHPILVYDVRLEWLSITTASNLGAIITHKHDPNILTTASIAARSSVMITTQFNLFYSCVVTANFGRLLMLEPVFMVWTLIRVSELVINVGLLLWRVSRMRSTYASSISVALGQIINR